MPKAQVRQGAKWRAPRTDLPQGIRQSRSIDFGANLLKVPRQWSYSFKLDPSGGNDSSSSGVISDQSSSNGGGAPIDSFRHAPHDATSTFTPARCHSASTICTSPSSGASVHWGETRVHTYEREEVTDAEDVVSMSSSSASSASMPSLPLGESIVEIDVDKVMESRDAEPKSRPTPAAYEETNLDAADFKCPACVFDCGPIHPYMKNTLLQPQQCFHDDLGQVTCNGLHRTASPPSVSSSDSSFGCTPGKLRPHRHSQPSLRGTGASVAENNSSFACISDNLLLLVFSHLSAPDLCRTARVCKRWYRNAWTPSLWTSVTLEGSKRGVDADKGLRAVTKILSYSTYPLCTVVEHVVVRNNSSLTDRGVFTLAKRCPELRSVDIRGCTRVTNMAVFELVSRCLSLEHLNMSGCDQVSCVSLTPEAARVVPSPTGQRIFLRQLDLSTCPRVDDASLSLIASHCTELTHLYLRRCTHLSDLGVQYVARYCSQLREISLNECTRLTDVSLAELTSRLGAQLRYISVAKCSQLTDAGVVAVAQRCPKLRYLNLRGCTRVSDASIEFLAQRCSRLRSLDLGCCDVSDDSLLGMAHGCPQLRRISLRGCDAVTDRGVEALAAGCPNLQLVNLQECSVSLMGYQALRSLCHSCIIEHNNPGSFL